MEKKTTEKEVVHGTGGGVFALITVGKLREASINIRSFYNEVKFRELVESVRGKGIITPLIVRPTDGDGTFEIAAGHRRFAAAKEVGLLECPAIVRQMSDTEFLEILTIENLQHEDVHPLDEASGYGRLIEQAGYDVAALCAKVSKSPSYIYQRLKLLDLVPEAREAFLKEKISAGHAILIARLQPRQQKDTLRECVDRGDLRRGGMSTRELERYIQEEIHLDLNSASFKKSDDTLTPAGPCTTCTKRTGFLPELFPDIKKKDTCTDPDCFHGKVAAFLKRRTEELKKDNPELLQLSDKYGPFRGLNDLRTRQGADAPIPDNLYKIVGKQAGSCESQQKGILVDGRETGKVLTVCIDPKCKVHRGEQLGSHLTPKERAVKKAQAEKEKIETAIRERILDATVAAWPIDPDRDDWGFLAGQFFKELWHEYRKKLLARHELKPIKQQYGQDYEKPILDWIGKASKTDLIRLIFEMALTRNIQRPFGMMGKRSDPLMEQAKTKVDVKKIEAAVRSQFKEKMEKKDKKVKKPKKGEKKKPKRSATPQGGKCQYCGCTTQKPCIRVQTNETCGWANKERTICTFCAEKHPVKEKKQEGKRPSTKKAKGCICDPKRRPDQLRVNPYCRAQHAG